jgi:Protein of unknown function (DUF1254)
LDAQHQLSPRNEMSSNRAGSGPFRVPNYGLRVEERCHYQASQKDAVNGVPVPTLAETKAISLEGFIFGLPIVMYYTSAYELFVDPTSSQYKAPVGQLFNEARVFTPKDTAGITPNSDTPYSLQEIDLRAEPTVISVPAVPKLRYYSVQLTDANTFNYGCMGSRTTGTGPGDYMVVGPDWKGQPPANIKHVFHSTMPFSAVIFRTQLFNAADMPNVVKIQAGYKVQPLSAYLKKTCTERAPGDQLHEGRCGDCEKAVLASVGFCAAIYSAQPGRGCNSRQAGQHRYRSRKGIRCEESLGRT